ncbi:MAG: hypothetical protein CK425_11995 [Parachlamydia sp.]|nr:MAG: hypothetical protein CK425_11995 [Parachlamydia sp.]
MKAPIWRKIIKAATLLVLIYILKHSEFTSNSLTNKDKIKKMPLTLNKNFKTLSPFVTVFQLRNRHTWVRKNRFKPDLSSLLQG